MTHEMRRATMRFHRLFSTKIARRAAQQWRIPDVRFRAGIAARVRYISSNSATQFGPRGYRKHCDLP